MKPGYIMKKPGGQRIGPTLYSEVCLLIFFSPHPLKPGCSMNWLKCLASILRAQSNKSIKRIYTSTDYYYGVVWRAAHEFSPFTLELYSGMDIEDDPFVFSGRFIFYDTSPPAKIPGHTRYGNFYTWIFNSFPRLLCHIQTFYIA